MKKPAWLDTQEYPFASRSFAVHGHTMHYVDEGAGEPVLFVHGTPSWSFDFRQVICALSPTARCLAIDHIGFGLSDKPRHYDYSTVRHADALEQFVIAHDLKNLTLVLHDFGGPIGFEVALRHPARVRQMVLLNTWLWNTEQEPEFIKFKKVLNSPLLPFLYRRLNFSARFILPSSFGEKKLSRAIRRHYTSPFGSAHEREGTLAFARSLVNDQDWFGELWARREALADKRMALIWGEKDPVLPVKYVEKFQQGFPMMDIHSLPTVGHFPQEEAPDEVVEILKRYI